MFRIEIDHEWQLEKTQAALLRKFPWEFQRQYVDAQLTANFSLKKVVVVYFAIKEFCNVCSLVRMVLILKL